MKIARDKFRQPVLVIGGTGQVGRELLVALAPLGTLVATARDVSAVRGSTACRALDAADLDAVRQTVREVRPAVIINAAAYTAVDRAESETDLALSINGLMPGVLAEEARQLNAALVHYSTDYVFDGSGTRPWREDDQPRPLNTYGRTKLAGEEAIQAAGAAHAILRISWIYAAVGQNFVHTMLRLGAEREELRLVADQIGARRRPRKWRPPRDRFSSRSGRRRSKFCASAAARCTCRAPARRAGTTSPPRFFDWRGAGLPMRVERVLPIATAEYPTPARRPLNSRLDGRLAAERFGLSLPDWQAAFATEFPGILARLAR